MQRYLIGRLGQALGVLFVVSVVTFVLIHSAPGGPAILLQGDLTQEQIKERMADLGLDDPFPIQYLRWLGNVLQGQLGRSLSQGARGGDADLGAATGDAPAQRHGAAAHPGHRHPPRRAVGDQAQRPDRPAGDGFAFFGMSVPVFWLGILLILLFSVQSGLLPSAGMYSLDQPFSIGDRLRYLIMPTIVLATANLAQITRYTSSSVLSVLAEDYIRTARAKGLAHRVIMTRHALRAALIPVITIVGVMLPRLVTGAAITEAIFAWPGMGRLAVDAAVQRDYPLVMGITLMVSAVVIVSNLLVDMVYGWADPRIRVAD